MSDTTVEAIELPPAVGSIHERMVAVMTELPAIGKGRFNEQQRFAYRGHDDVMNALNPLLCKHGVFLVPHVLERVTAERVAGSGKTMYEVNLHVEFTFWAADGTKLRASTWGEGTDMGDKSTNKAMTMAFKNVLAVAFAISTEELSAGDEGSVEETTRYVQENRQAQEGRQQSKPREFDVARDLLEGAIKVASLDDANALRLALRDFDPAQDWPAIEEYVANHVFERGLNSLTPKQTTEYWTRLANTVVKIGDLAGPGDFPPPSPEQIAEGFAYGFNGVVLALSGPVTPSQDELDAEAVEAAAADTGGQDDA